MGQDAVFLFADLQHGGALRHQIFEKAPQTRQFQMGANAGAHLIDVERLGDVVGGTELEALDLFLDRIDHGDEDHRNVVALGR